MGAEVNIIVERVSNVPINNDPRHWIAVFVRGRTCWGKEANVMSLLSHDNSELGLWKRLVFTADN